MENYKHLSKILRRITNLIKDPELIKFDVGIIQTLRIAWSALNKRIKADKRRTGYRKQHDTIPILKRPVVGVLKC